MNGPGRRRSGVRPLVGLLLAWALLLAGSVAPPGPVRAAGWSGGIDLYRSGSFTTQQSWLWCTAADVQIIRNIVRHEADHSGATQGRYFSYMRAHNRYDIPVSDGVDPAGWTAGLRHYVDARYRLVVSGSFDAALRSAVTNLWKTRRPVGLLVAHGDHAWILTGFTATADPAVTSRFTVTSVRVTGPLWGLQSRSFGYDMRPDTKLTPKQLAGFFTPWHYAGVRMAWEGRWVSIQAFPAKSAAPAPTPAPRATPAPKATPIVAPSRGPRPTATLAASPSPSPIEVAAVGSAGSPPPSEEPATPASSVAAATGLNPGLVLLAMLAALGLAFGARFAIRSRQPR